MNRSVSLDVLDRIQIASPCHMRWEDMAGDDRKRFCGECSLNVYNLSEMSREEAVALIGNAEGRLCAGFWRRPDGTILTRDCPVGLAALRARAAAGLRRVAAAIALLVGSGILLGASKGPASRLRHVPPFAALCDWLSPGPPPIRGQIVWTSGDVCLPVQQPARPTGAGAPR